MQKMMKNWIFTLIVCILLSVLSVLMFLDGFGVGDLYIGQQIIHILTAVTLLLYVIFAVIPLVARYRHKGVRGFLIAEIAILLLTVFAQGFGSAVRIPFFSDMQACSVVGLALWLGCAMQLIRAYLVKGVEEQKQVPLWLFCIYILLGAAGVWQIVDPLIEDRYFIFGIAVLSLVFAVTFGVFTAQNRKALPKKPKKEKTPKGEDTVAPVAELPAPAVEQTEEQPERQTTTQPEQLE